MQFIEPSNENEFYMKHVSALKPCELCPIDKAFALPKVEYSLGCLKDVLNTINVGNVAFVAIEHESVYEIRRLPDGASAKLYYQYLAKSKEEPSLMDKCENTILRVIGEYTKQPLAENIKYDPNLTEEMKLLNIVSRSYLQRRVLSLFCFKADATNFEDTLEKLIKKYKLVEVASNVCKEQFKTKAKLYQIPVAPEPL